MGRSNAEQAKLRVLHIIATADPVSGGPIEGILRQNDATRHIAKRTLVTLDSPGAQFLSSLDIEIYPLGEDRPNPLRILRHYGVTSRMIPWLRRHSDDYDVIVVNGLWNFATFAVSRTLPGGSTPYFVFTHGMMDPWFKKTYPLKHWAKTAFWLAVEGRLLAGAKRVLFTSEEEKLLARGQFPFWRYREQVVGYGTAPTPAPNAAQKAAFEALAPGLGGRPYLLFLSRIHRKKGCDLLIEAFAKACGGRSELQLVVAGPDQENVVGRLKERAGTLGVADRIHWPGMLKGDAKWGAYHGAEAFILPSHQENFGIVVAEALACSLPVLITNKVNIWREVEGAKAGLVRNDDQAGVDALLADWLSLPISDREQMRLNAYAAFERYFNVENVAPALIETIKSSL